MPEMPEVETVRRGLEKLLSGARIRRVESLWPASFIPQAGTSLEGRGFTGFRRYGKLLVLDLDDGSSLLIHLRMTGQLVYQSSAGNHFGAGHPSDSLVDPLPDRSTRVIIHLEDATLYFNDQRKFGYIRQVPTPEVERDSFVRSLGPDPLGPDYTLGGLRLALQKRCGTSIKAALLDQHTVAGIGNIYADEALWLARIHPARRAGTIGASELRRLYAAIPKVLLTGLEHGGSSDRNYVNAEGKRGAYLDFAEVFRRQGQPCRRCKAIIVKIRVAGRGTHLCPTCQKAQAQ